VYAQAGQVRLAGSGGVGGLRGWKSATIPQAAVQTWSGWLNPSSSGQDMIAGAPPAGNAWVPLEIYAYGGGGSGAIYGYSWGVGGLLGYVGAGGNGVYDGTWIYAALALTADGRLKGYFNGNLTVNVPVTASVTTGLSLCHCAGSWGCPGYVDEVRVMPAEATAPWLLANVNNQSAPTTFWTTGAVELAPSAFAGTGRTVIPYRLGPRLLPIGGLL
jgi:hypothetical protein